MSEWLEEIKSAIEGENEVSCHDLKTISSRLAAKRIVDEFVIIPKSALPPVSRSQYDESSYTVEGQNIVFTSLANARQWVYRDIAVWQFMEDEDRANNVRRDELASQFLVGSGLYKTATESTKAAIDYIIKLEADK